MPDLYPYDVFDNPIATEGRLSSSWGLPGEDPDESYPQDTGYPGEIAGPNYLLEEDEIPVINQVRAHLFDFSSALDSGYGSLDEYGSFGADPTVCDPRIQSCPPGTPIPGEIDWGTPPPAPMFGPVLPPGYVAPPAVDPAAAGAAKQYTSTLRKGSTGTAVSNWQSVLRSTGFPDVPLSGTFDNATFVATKEWQRRRGLGVDGKVGRNTRGAIGTPELTMSSWTSPSRSYSPPRTTTTTTTYKPPAPPATGEGVGGFLTTRNIAIGLLGISVLGTIAVVAFGGDKGKNEPGLAW